jgi:hypothetical protein
MATVDLSDISEDNKFQALRAQAIEQYASVEQSLASLFSALLGTTPIREVSFFFERKLAAMCGNGLFEKKRPQRRGR